MWAIGPAVTIRFCTLATQPFSVPTVVNLNSNVVDGTGMCGACRVEEGGNRRFACVDAPEFDGHEVGWGPLMARQRIYLEVEKQGVERWRRECQSPE